MSSFITVRRTDGGTNMPPWPVRHSTLEAALRAHWRALLEFAAAADTDAQATILLIGVRLSGSSSALAEAAMAIAGETVAGVIVEGPPEIAYLRDGGTLPAPTTVRTAADSARYSHAWARRLARVASWTPIHRLPLAWLKPDAIAVSHNPLLRDSALREARNVGFRHADAWLGEIRATHPAPRTEFQDLAAALARHMARAIPLPTAIGDRLATLIAVHARPMLENAGADLAALRRAKLPNRLWSGTGGQYAGRAIGLEILRRGGAVERFDHGGSGAGLYDAEGMSLIEFAVTSSYVAPTERLIEPVRAQRLAPWPCEIRGADGDPTFRMPALPPQPKSNRSRVLYVSTAVLGFRRVSVINLADQLYLDWQIEMATALGQLPIDLSLRPHPEGLYRGRTHPLAAHGKVEARPFEQLVPETDVFVFDFPASTTFWYAMCTDRPIVYLDLGVVPFAASLTPALRRRLHIIPVPYGADNRPVLDRGALAAAISESAPVDASEFRRLFAGRP